MSSGAISVLIGMLPEMNTTEPYSPSARANASAKPVRSGGKTSGEDHVPERLPARGAEHRGRLFEIGVQSSSTGCTVRTTKGKPDEREHDDTPSGVNATLRPSAASGAPSQPVRRVDRGHGDAGHRGRQREGQIDERVDHRLSEEPVAHEHPRQEQPHERVQDGADRRGPEGELVGGQRARVGHHAEELGRPERARLEEERRERDRAPARRDRGACSPSTARTRARLRASSASRRSGSATAIYVAWLVDLVEDAAVVEVRLLGLLPVAGDLRRA